MKKNNRWKKLAVVLAVIFSVLGCVLLRERIKYLMTGIMSGLSIPEMALLVTLISLFGGITTGNLVALFYRHKNNQDGETKNGDNI